MTKYTIYFILHDNIDKSIFEEIYDNMKNSKLDYEIIIGISSSLSSSKVANPIPKSIKQHIFSSYNDKVKYYPLLENVDYNKMLIIKNIKIVNSKDKITEILLLKDNIIKNEYTYIYYKIPNYFTNNAKNMAKNIGLNIDMIISNYPLIYINYMVDLIFQVYDIKNGNDEKNLLTSRIKELILSNRKINDVEGIDFFRNNGYNKRLDLGNLHLDDNSAYKLKPFMNLLNKQNQTDQLIGIEKILDIGGGDGSITLALKEEMNIKDGNIMIVDPYSSKDLEQSGIKIYHPDDYDKIEDNSIDMAVMSYVIHHIDKNIFTDTLQKINKKLRYNGVLLIKEHNYNDENDENYDNADIIFFNFLFMIHVIWLDTKEYKSNLDDYKLFLYDLKNIKDIMKQYNFEYQDIIQNTSIYNIYRKYHAIFKKISTI